MCRMGSKHLGPSREGVKRVPDSGAFLAEHTSAPETGALGVGWTSLERALLPLRITRHLPALCPSAWASGASFTLSGLAPRGREAVLWPAQEPSVPTASPGRIRAGLPSNWPEAQMCQALCWAPGGKMKQPSSVPPPTLKAHTSAWPRYQPHSICALVLLLSFPVHLACP